jgi:saccharopine dehydrogenase-like NADP-dependent oxidoreductase
MVDVSYMPEDIMTLNGAALRAGIRIVPDCGMSPGLGNIFVGHAVCNLDEVEKVHILNGGLPEKPVPPLGYVITWSVKDLVDMYSRKVTIVKNGRAVQVKAMSGLEEIVFPGVGKLEAFYTDGLRTLLHTVRAKEMWEKTLRYPGHAEKINSFKAMGFFSDSPIEVDGMRICPRDVTTKLFERKLKRPEIRDIVIMHVEVTGIKDGNRTKCTYHLLDRYDKKRQVSSMARTTAYTTSAVTQLLAEEAIEEKGVVPPEKLGMNKEIFRKFTSKMRKHRLSFREDEKRLD